MRVKIHARIFRLVVVDNQSCLSRVHTLLLSLSSFHLVTHHKNPFKIHIKRVRRNSTSRSRVSPVVYPKLIIVCLPLPPLLSNIPCRHIFPQAMHISGHGYRCAMRIYWSSSKQCMYAHIRASNPSHLQLFVQLRVISRAQLLYKRPRDVLYTSVTKNSPIVQFTIIITTV